MFSQSPVQNEARLERLGWWLPALMFVVCVLPYSFTYLKHHPDERHYTDAALEMVRTGDYLTPRTQYGELRFKKPILTYWIVAGSHHVFGVSPLSSRLPFVLMGAAIIGLTYCLGLKVLQQRSGAWLAALIVAFHPTLILASSQSIPDIVLSLTILLSMLGFCDLFARRQASFMSYLLAYGGIGLAILAKGIPGAAFGLVAVAVSVWFGTWGDRSQRVKHGLALFLACLGTGVWFVLVYWRHGDAMIDEFFRDQVIARSSPQWWRPLIQLPQVFGLAIVSYLPWTGWLWIGGRPSWRATSEQVRQNRGLQFLGIWSLVFLLLASCVDLVILRYQVVVTPALSVVLAARLLSLQTTLVEAGFRRQARLMTGTLGIALGACVVFVAALSDVSWSLITFVLLAASWTIWAWRTIPSRQWRAAGLVSTVSVGLLMPCGYFAIGAMSLPTFEELVSREVQEAKLEQETLLVVGRSVYTSRLRIFSQDAMLVRSLRDSEFETLQSDGYADANAMLFVAHAVPPEVASQFTLIAIPHGLDVKLPALYQSLRQGNLRKYLTSCQRSAYLAVRTSHLQGHSLATRPAGESMRN